MFYVSVLSIVLVVCITPTLTFAERNSGQHENENPLSPETGEAGVESRALDLIKTAEQHAMDDISNYLWFIAGAGACMIVPVGAILGYHIGASSTRANSTSEFDLMAIPVPDDKMIVGCMTGCVGGVIATAPLAWIYYQKPKPSPERLLGKSPEYVEAYTRVYVSKAKLIRRKWISLGAATAALGGCLYLFPTDW